MRGSPDEGTPVSRTAERRGNHRGETGRPTRCGGAHDLFDLSWRQLDLYSGFGRLRLTLRGHRLVTRGRADLPDRFADNGANVLL